MELRELLKNARKAKEKTLEQVAKDLKVPLTTLSGWERGAGVPRGVRRDKVEAYYNFQKGTIELAVANEATGAREINVSQLTHDSAMSDYQTKPVMLHKRIWEMALEVQKQGDDVGLNEMFARLIKAASK